MKMIRAHTAHSPPGNATVNATISATGRNAAASAAEKRARAAAAAAKRQRQQADPELRTKEAEARRKRHLQESTEAMTASAAEAQRQRRQANIEAARQRESAAKAAKRLKQLLQPGTDGADARFKRAFLYRSFGHSCKVCDRLWFDKNLTKIASIKNEQSRANAIAVLQRKLATDDNHGEYSVCSTYKGSLVAGKVPAMSLTNGYRYPPKLEHLPELNPVEERLIAPRLPFMSIRRLTHGNGQYGIKGQVVNVPIEVQDLVQCLPRNVPEDAAIDVHIKRRLVSKASYRRGLVKKGTVHVQLFTEL
ncbi:uncharacterized protein LOC125757387 [Rhipicephalus sanguineus]|uniref:uncharacterized protein LOC125757387 n=1 Tax=Rhipicephalus sanguineus TaxID=34632 RepID=UPI0020C4A313|nr:uncharacterized protein LOC125757387 [Rhipicephalus sanguineus]